MIKNSFDLLIPVLVVVLTLYPLSLLIQSQFGMLIPQAIMSIFKPLVSAADSLPAILLAVLIGHLLWFAGIHGAAIVSGMLQMFWLTNLGGEPDRAGGKPAFATHLYGSLLDVLYRYRRIGGDDGSGVLLSA